jgi:glutathione peroxidase-family protein
MTKRDYNQLATLADEYGERGFQILAFPSGQFLNQEYNEASEIEKFVNDRMGMKDKVVLFEKGNVNGSDAREVFTFLKDKLGGGQISWNFNKFLVDCQGEPYSRWGSQDQPSVMISDIEKLLDQKEGGKPLGMTNK